MKKNTLHYNLKLIIKQNLDKEFIYAAIEQKQEIGIMKKQKEWTTHKY